MIKLATKRKHLTNIIKMVAYQAESDLLVLLRRTKLRLRFDVRAPRQVGMAFPDPAHCSRPEAAAQA